MKFNCRLRFPIWLMLALFLKGSPAQATPPVAATSAGKQPRSAPQEDWTSLSLSSSHLQPQPPIRLETSTLSTFTRELVCLQWRALDPIHLYIIRPKGVQKPPVALFLYSYPGDTTRFLNNGYCERAVSNGYAIVGFDTALTGERYRMRPMREWFVSELQEALASSVHDVQLILNYLTSRQDFDRNRVGIFGQGSGGAIAILAAATDPRIRAVDLLTPWCDWSQWLAKSPFIPSSERPRYLEATFQKKIAGYDPCLWLPRLQSRSVRLMLVKEDAVTPASCQERLAKAAPAKTSVLRYETASALFGAVSGGRMFVWMGEQLGTQPTEGTGGKNR